MKKKNVNLEDFVICKIRACEIYIDDKDHIIKLIENGGSLGFPSKVVGYVVGKYNEKTGDFIVGISMISVNDANKELYQHDKTISGKKSLTIAINKLDSKIESPIYKRFANKSIFFSYNDMVRVLDYTLAQTVNFVVNRLMKKHNISDINANQIKVRF